jgi:nucleoside 2-deoxyribosyltransferase
MRAYIAAGWFSPEQEKARQEVLKACKDAGITVYSPKEDFLYVPGETSASEVFEENLRHINDCDFMIASTEGKDMGTIFECGYAFAQSIPIVYYYKGQGNFNLMLSESGSVVCTVYEQLFITLKDAAVNHFIKVRKYKGHVE